MKILRCVKPGVLEYAASDTPVPADGETLLKVRNIGICGTDLHAFDGTQPYFTYPRVLGHEISAETVESRGEDKIRAGEKVTFLPYDYCGHCVACRNGRTNCCANLKVFGVHKDGGMCEFIVVPSRLVFPSTALTFESLAIVEPLSIGAHAVRVANVQPEQFVVVVGAGPIGLGVMQFAMARNASVIAIDVNPLRLSVCREKFGVPYVVDAAAPDLNERLLEITRGQMADVVMDATGSLHAITRGFDYMAHGGKYILVGLQKGNITFSHPEFHKREATLMSSRNATWDDFVWVTDAIAEGRIDPSKYITHRVDFDVLAQALPAWSDPAKGVIKGMAAL